jgi:hypothetical protein
LVLSRLDNRLVQISLLKKGNLDSKKHLNGTFPNPKAQERHKKGLYERGIKKFFGEPGFGQDPNISNSEINSMGPFHFNR